MAEVKKSESFSKESFLAKTFLPLLPFFSSGEA